MVHGLADIVEQRHAARLFFIQAQLGSHRAADKRRFDGMKQHILRITVAIFEPSQKLDNSGWTP